MDVHKSIEMFIWALTTLTTVDSSHYTPLLLSSVKCLMASLKFFALAVAIQEQLHIEAWSQPESAGGLARDSHHFVHKRPWNIIKPGKWWINPPNLHWLNHIKSIPCNPHRHKSGCGLELIISFLLGFSSLGFVRHGARRPHLLCVLSWFGWILGSKCRKPHETTIARTGR